jgi:hypothetical protein
MAAKAACGSSQGNLQKVLRPDLLTRSLPARATEAYLHLHFILAKYTQSYLFASQRTSQATSEFLFAM